MRYIPTFVERSCLQLLVGQHVLLRGILETDSIIYDNRKDLEVYEKGIC